MTGQVGKIPELTLLFWIIKVAATTLGETAGDAVSMSMNLGYLLGTLIFATIFLIAAFFQIQAKKFNSFVYWLTIIATTTVGTTLADFADRSLGIGYAGGASLLFILLTSSLFVWRRCMGSVSVSSVNNTKTEIFYWVTLLFSQTLGTALGDWAADSMGLGYAKAAAIFALLIAVVVGFYFWTRVSRTALFWAAFILTRPLGAALGDFFDKPVQAGGLAMSRYQASLELLGFILICILAFPQRARQ